MQTTPTVSTAIAITAAADCEIGIRTGGALLVKHDATRAKRP